MGYVPGFDWDIFLSYPMEAESWVKQFEQDLRDGGRLAAARGLRIYFAHRDWRLGDVGDDMLAAARRSAIFVAVITTDALSPDEKRFLQREMEAFVQSGPLKGRFCPIALDPIEPSHLSRAIPIANPHDFWNMAVFYFYDRGTPLWLEPDIEPGRGYYKREIRRLAHQLRRLLDTLAPGAVPPASDVTGAFSGRTVFLARPESNSHILTEWEDIQKLLLNDGATVVPNGTSESQTAIQNAELFVQLLSPLDSLGPARAQFELAERRGIPLLQWRDKLSNSRADQTILERLAEEDKQFCQGANVQSGSLENFKTRIREELEKIRRRLEREDLPAVAASDKPYLYITADTVDLPLARRLQIAARSMTDADIMVQDEAQRLGDFEQGLKQASGMIFLYGQTTPQFVNLWLQRYVRQSRLLNHHPKIAALYLAPPERSEEEEPLVPTGELLTLGSHGEFTLQGIEKICAELSGDRV